MHDSQHDVGSHSTAQHEATSWPHCNTSPGKLEGGMRAAYEIMQLHAG